MGKYIDGSGLSHFMGIIKSALAGKSDTSHTHSGYVSDVAYNSTSRKLTQSKNGGSATDIVTLATVATSGSYSDLSSKPSIPSANSTATNIKMDGTQSAGSLTTYAKADHVHPTDTSRAAASHTHAISDVTNLQTNLDGKAPTSHASTATTYGAGTSSNYGHVKLSDATNGTAAAASGGTAATPKAVADALAAAEAYADDAISDWEGGTQSANTVYAGPASGSAAAPTFRALTADDVPNHSTGKLTSGTLGVARGGTGASTLGAGVVYHSASGTGALSIATAANLVSAIGNSAVNRATADASGNNIANTYATKSELSTATAGALQYKGTASASADITDTSYKKGWYWVIDTAGTFAGHVCEVGDMLIAKQDKTATPANDFDAIQSNIETLSNSEIDALWAAA